VYTANYRTLPIIGNAQRARSTSNLRPVCGGVYGGRPRHFFRPLFALGFFAPTGELPQNRDWKNLHKLIFSLSSLLTKMPRRRKSFAIRKRWHSAPAAVRLPPSRTGKRKQWTEENMLLALKAVKEGVSVSKAAQDFDVPRSTLYDRVSGRV
jgi:hypothetical protein